MDGKIRSMIGSTGKQMEENWRQWKRNLFSRYNRNPFLKQIRERKERIQGWNDRRMK